MNKSSMNKSSMNKSSQPGWESPLNPSSRGGGLSTPTWESPLNPSSRGGGLSLEDYPSGLDAFGLDKSTGSRSSYDPAALTAGGLGVAGGAIGVPLLSLGLPAAVGGINALTHKKEKGKAFLRGGVGTLGTMMGADIGHRLFGTLPAGLTLAVGGAPAARPALAINALGGLLGTVGGGIGGYMLSKKLMDNAMPYEEDRQRKQSELDVGGDSFVRGVGGALSGLSLATPVVGLGIPALNTLMHRKEKSKAALRALTHMTTLPTGITAGALMGGGLGLMASAPWARNGSISTVPPMALGGLIGAIAGGIGSYKLTNKLLDTHMPYKHNDEE